MRKPKSEPTTFSLKCGYTVVCRSERTRYGFRHLASVRDTRGNEVATAKACYYNRTWESFTFETVIREALSKCTAFDKAAVESIMQTLRDEAHGKIKRDFAFIGGIAKLGEILCDKPADQNDWKARMLKAGLPGFARHCQMEHSRRGITAWKELHTSTVCDIKTAPTRRTTSASSRWR